jgi:hypothetical protein
MDEDISTGREVMLRERYSVSPDVVSSKQSLTYCNEFDQRIARQQLCKHGPTCNSRGCCVLRVRCDVTQRWVVVT